MFEFLFKYSKIVYEQGIWAFRNMPGWGWLLLAVVALAAVLFFIYRKTIAPTSALLRASLASLKIAALLIILLIIAEPFISITSIVPKKGTVLVLLDNSESMSITDSDDQKSRAEKVSQWLGSNQNPGIKKALEQNFNVLIYQFGEAVTPLDESDSLQATGKFTDLTSALAFAEKQTQTHPISSVILVTDGAETQSSATSQSENAGSDPLQLSATLKNADIPVYTVGVGSEIVDDIQLTNISSSHSVTENDIVEMTALIHTRNTNQRTATIELLEDGEVIETTQVALNNKYTRVNLTHQPGKKGFLQYTARIVPDEDEIIEVNNERHFLVNNEEKVAQILYVEELHPWEFKFLKRAIDLDKSLRLISLVRTGPEKFYRQGIQSENELKTGFPRTKSELYSYEAIIIGSIGADLLTEEQQRLLKSYVSERGGGLLMLGGPKAFTQGGWQNTEIVDILPVDLLDDAEAAQAYSNPLRLQEFQLQLTPEGLRSPILQLSPDLQMNREMWLGMPELKGYNPLGAAKPGASVLGIHPLSQPDREKIIIAEQRYGRGRSMVIANSTIWLWQMKLEAADVRHETFWRQVVRWLALSAPEPVAVHQQKENYSPGEQVTMQINALDSSFSAVNNANLTVEVTVPFGANGRGETGRGDPPVGASRMLDVLPDLSRPGQYKAQFNPGAEGLYQVDVTANDPAGKFLGHATTSFFVADNHIEFQRPDLQESLLKRIAEISGGKYLHISTADNIADELAIAKSSYSKTVERDIWDSPALFFIILLLLAAEWIARRAKGLS